MNLNGASDPRPGEASFRLENLSDAVFGFALTLLVVSAVVPASYGELLETFEGLPAFALAFSVLVYIWRLHGRFFRAHSGDDGITVVLNAVLLFVVLFYVYPLKFLADVLVLVVHFFVGGSPAVGRELERAVTLEQLSSVFVLYGLGFVAVFGVLAALYARVLRRTDAGRLTELEVFDARSDLWFHLTHAGVGGLSIIVALSEVGIRYGSPGWVYALLGPLLWEQGAYRDRRRPGPDRRKTPVDG